MRIFPLLATLALVLATIGHAMERRLAITIDDLPAARPVSLENVRALTARLTGALLEEDLPAMGSVNLKKLADLGLDSLAAARELEPWLAGRLELGNHTWSHPWFWSVDADSMARQVLAGEAGLRNLCAANGKPLRWFRHPYLNTGPDSTQKARFETFLADHGYQVAPVTFDNDEYVHARAYELARDEGDQALQDRVLADYLAYMDAIAAHYEALSVRLLGREPAQILLIHANWLNAEHMDQLLAVFRRRGYGFVPLAEALKDPAYGHADRYLGKRGTSWLERWAHTDGIDPGQMPEAAQWVRNAAGLD